MTPSTPIRSINGRRDPRYRVAINVTLAHGRKHHRLRTGDVSLRGLFLRSDQPLKPRSFLRLEINLPYLHQTLSLFGSVAFAVLPDNPEGRTPGCGVSFYGNDKAILEVWEQFVRAVAKRHPESLTQPVSLVEDSDGQDPVRRRHQRFEAEIRVKARFEQLDELVLLYTRDVSKGGMLIETNVLAVPDTKLFLSLVHPLSGEEMTVACRVRRVVDDRQLRGLAVEFVGLDEVLRHRLWEFVCSTSPEIPRDDHYRPDPPKSAKKAVTDRCAPSANAVV